MWSVFRRTISGTSGGGGFDASELDAGTQQEPQAQKVAPIYKPPQPQHQLLGKVDPGCVYDSDVHPALRQRSRPLSGLPPLQAPVDIVRRPSRAGAPPPPQPAAPALPVQ